MILYFINMNFLTCFILWEPKKNDFSAQLCLLRVICLPRSLHASPPCFRRVGIFWQTAECKGRNSLLVSAKNLQLRHLTKYRIFGAQAMAQKNCEKSFTLP